MNPPKPPSDADIERQERMRQARDEFNALWAGEKPVHMRNFGPAMLRAELLAWQFFLRGKGLK